MPTVQIMRDGQLVEVDASTIQQDTPEQVQTKERARVFGEINAERSRRISYGSEFAVSDVDDPVPLTGRDFDQSVYLALLMRAQGYKAAGITTPVLTLRDRNDVVHVLTADQMMQLITQAMTWFESIMAISWDMKDGTGDFTDGIPEDFTEDKWWP